MNVDRVPVAFVALDDAGASVGTASLVFVDWDGDPRNPWLTSVCVSACSGKGIASAVVRTVEGCRAAHGNSRVYLLTTSATPRDAGLGAA